MTTQVVIVYTSLAASLVADTAAVAARMDPSVVPLPMEELLTLGAGPSTDAITIGPPTFRTVTMALVPNVLPTATLTRDQSFDAGPIIKVTITNRGQNVIAAPFWQVTDSTVLTPAQVAGGITIPERNALLSSTLRARAGVPVTILNGGTGYTNPTIIPIGGRFVTGQDITFTITLGLGGTITAIAINGQGSGYITAPWGYQIVDSTGSGAVLGDTLDMEIEQITIVDAGAGYIAPVATAIPAFKKTWPDSLGAVAQRQPFINLLTGRLQQSAKTKVTETVSVT